MNNREKNILIVVICILILGLGVQYVQRITRTSLPGDIPSLSDNILPVQVNTASRGELERLPGIGPVIAERIIAYRESFGPFKEIDELKKIHGIGSVKINKIAPYISFNDTVK